MKIPIACTLDAAGAQAQVVEWRSVLTANVVETERLGATRVRMKLRTRGAGISEIVALAQREVACCAFFRFAIEIDADGAALVVSVPADAAPVLDSFTTLVAG